MNRIIKALFLVFALCCSFQVQAQQQERRRFNPQKFEADLEQFITTEACLTPQESEVFFPIYREMRKKQMMFFMEERRFKHLDLKDDKACEEAVKKHDANEIKIKELQQSYHNKFLRILPASKVLSIIKAEEQFHRQLMKRATNRPRPFDN